MTGARIRRTVRNSSCGNRAGVVLGCVLATACADEPPTPPPHSASVSVVAPAELSFTVGDTFQLAAEVRDQWGRELPGAVVEWSSSDSRVASVGPSGLVAATGAGTATITAISVGASGSAQLAVSETVSAELSDREILEILYHATNGPNWDRSENWLTDAPLEEWYGVTTDGEGRVVVLRLSDNGLSGPIPPELGQLARLEMLVFGIYNNLYGPIPPELGNLANLTQLSIGLSNLSGPIPPELGNLANLTSLGLGYNSLSGPVPPELGQLTNLTSLSLHRNELSGPIPSSFLRLDGLTRLSIGSYRGSNQSLCVPGTPDFVAWLPEIHDDTGGPAVFCNAGDVAALKLLYNTAGGTEWSDTTGWAGDGAVGEWHGVTADSLGRVVTLDLAGNGLNGRLPQMMGTLTEMRVLRVGGNALSGRLPSSLANVPLREFRYEDTELCAPSGERFRAWLNGIESHEGDYVECPPLSDREVLKILYEATGGPGWWRNRYWLDDVPLDYWYGVTTDSTGERVTRLRLYANFLSGPIPPELGNLADLAHLDLGGNELVGLIPPELASLANLTHLYLDANDLFGPIPPELGNFASLTTLHLDRNDLVGPIPPELSYVADLEVLTLFDNDLSGEIPPKLGYLSNLIRLSAGGNNLWGTVPIGFGYMSSLRALDLSHNPMVGTLPADLTALVNLEELTLGGTGLCAPADEAFQDWLAGVRKRRVPRCTGATAAPAVYLVQAVQSREFPVPLVAGETALLRVFPTAREATNEGIPAIQARFYRDGLETHVVDIPGKSTPIPTEVDEGSLSKSANAEIPGQVVQAGLELVIEIDPEGTLDPSLGVATRIPETGRLEVEVREMPLFELTLIPFVWTENHDSAIVDLTGAMAADPYGHEMFGHMHLLPVGEMAVVAHEPVLSSSNSAFSLLSQTVAIRAMEGGTGHYKGMMSPPVTGAGGVAYVPGWSSFSQPHATIIAHELGHNLSLYHAPCGGAGGPDPTFPYSDGTAGAWGYDFRNGGSLVGPHTPDLMSYCDPNWISDYYFANALRFRLSDWGQQRAQDASRVTSLLLWGGIDADSMPFLEPAFVVDAPPTLPDAAGDHRLTGRADGGGELFSLSFGMPEVADADGRSGFAFILPVRAGWASGLATVTLTGPGGSVTLDGNAHRSMAILRNPLTGQVRAILRDLPTGVETWEHAVAAVSPLPGLELLFSRGIPEGVAWRR